MPSADERKTSHSCMGVACLLSMLSSIDIYTAVMLPSVMVIGLETNNKGVLPPLIFIRRDDWIPTTTPKTWHIFLILARTHPNYGRSSWHGITPCSPKGRSLNGKKL